MSANFPTKRELPWELPKGGLNAGYNLVGDGSMQPFNEDAHVNPAMLFSTAYGFSHDGRMQDPFKCEAARPIKLDVSSGRSFKLAYKKNQDQNSVDAWVLKNDMYGQRTGIVHPRPTTFFGDMGDHTHTGMHTGGEELEEYIRKRDAGFINAEPLDKNATHDGRVRAYADTPTGKIPESAMKVNDDLYDEIESSRTAVKIC
jgi:hypothetical protein